MQGFWNMSLANTGSECFEAVNPWYGVFQKPIQLLKAHLTPVEEASVCSGVSGMKTTGVLELGVSNISGCPAVMVVILRLILS